MKHVEERDTVSLHTRLSGFLNLTGEVRVRITMKFFYTSRNTKGLMSKNHNEKKASDECLLSWLGYSVESLLRDEMKLKVAFLSQRLKGIVHPKIKIH